MFREKVTKFGQKSVLENVPNMVRLLHVDKITQMKASKTLNFSQKARANHFQK